MKPTQSYLQFISDLRNNIVRSRYQAATLANREQLTLYFKTGQMLSERIEKENWGAKVMDEIADDLQKQLPGLKGFSRRNLFKMKQFFREYKSSSIWQTTTAKLQNVDNQGDAIGPSLTAQLDDFFRISFSHHILLMTKCKSKEERLFYIKKSATEFWSISLLEYSVDSNLFEKQGKLPNNFIKTLPEKLNPSAIQLFNDEYLMDYMNLGDGDDERVVENKIVANIRDFILRMGKGFSFIGNQFRVELDGEEFFIDLLFFNRHLRCLVAFELKKGKFKPKYAGQLNFYLNVLDERTNLPDENNSIGIVLCKEKSISTPMGVATFKTTREIPDQIKEILPNTVELVKLL